MSAWARTRRGYHRAPPGLLLRGGDTTGRGPVFGRAGRMGGLIMKSRIIPMLAASVLALGVIALAPPASAAPPDSAGPPERVRVVLREETSLE